MTRSWGRPPTTTTTATATPEGQRAEIEADIEAAFANGPDVAMVDSAKGITNLHVPNDVIIDASMPPVIRDSGEMGDGDKTKQNKTTLIPLSALTPQPSTLIPHSHPSPPTTIPHSLAPRP